MPKLNLVKLNKKTAWILWGLGAGIVLAIFTMALKPRLQRYEEVKQEIQKEEQNLNMARELISQRPLYESQIEAINQKIKFYEGKLPQRKETDLLLEELARIATEARIKYQFIKPGPMVSLKSEQVDLPYSRWPITMRLTCGYHELGLYLNQLENSTRFVQIDDLAIEAGEEVFNHKVTLNLSTYVAGK